MGLPTGQRVSGAAALVVLLGFILSMGGVGPSDPPGRTGVALPAPDRAPAPGAVAPGQLDCGYYPPERWNAELRAAVERGEVPDPATKVLPAVAPPRQRTAGSDEPPCLTPEHIFLYTDADSLLLTDFSFGQLDALMTDAANALLQQHGDNYDYIAFWINFAPHHTIGAAFYRGIVNNVSGIGQSQYNYHNLMGLGGHAQGYVMMWNINTSYWAPGSGGSASFTRLVLGQEFEHRFAMFLGSVDGLPLQGDNASCGRTSHWNWRVDGQGSGMEISEWVGDNPPFLAQSSVSFNTDIGGVWSYPDLYLMGYVSPQEMDAGASEFRYMTSSNCSASYPGAITQLSSSLIIANAGPRVPNSAQSQKDFRTAWIMIHLPGDPPSTSELNKAIGILQQHQIDWRAGTLDRGTMNDILFDDCNCNGSPDDDDVLNGNSLDSNGNQIPDDCEPCPEPDCDMDGVANSADNCPFVPNTAQTETDHDHIGDSCDNCPSVGNALQQNTDGDAFGNVCENCPLAPSFTPTIAGFQTIRAPNKLGFCWDDLVNIVWARGDLQNVSSYTIQFALHDFDACFGNPSDPPAGQGYYFLVRADCPGASWQTSLGAEPGRDAALP